MHDVDNRETWVAGSQAQLPDAVTLRRKIHEYPELGLHLPKTTAAVREALSGLDVKIEQGPSTSGMIVTLAGPTQGRTVLLRGDMDALPMPEDTDVPFKSKEAGRMHACGHDGHTSMLLGTATILSQLPERPHNILLLFQPAEEGGAGGMKLCEEGALDGNILGNPADRIYGLHCHPYSQVGQVSTCVGPMMASADSFHARITGRGGHAAMPHSTIDPVVITSQIILAWQTIASRNISPLDPVVVTCSEVHAGVAHNVIPDYVEVSGTIRTFKDETRELAIRRLVEIAEGLTALHGAKFEITWMTGYPVTKNDSEAESRWRKALTDFSGQVLPDPVTPVMGAEDFSFYGAKTKACFYWLGLNPNPEHVYPNLHAPEFDFNDAAIPYGVEAMCRLALAS